MRSSMIIPKELDSSPKVPSTLKKSKRKRTPVMSSANSSTHLSEKRMKLDNTSRSCRHLRRSLLRCYANYSKTGLPVRVMTNKMGEWVDLPHEVLDHVKEEFMLKKGAFEVEIDGRSYTLDFVHMLLVDMQTGNQASIAWIDEAGKFFFPEIVTEGDEPCTKGLAEDANCEEACSQEALERNKIKVEMDLDVDNMESMGESNNPEAQHPRKPSKNVLKGEIPESDEDETSGQLYASEREVFVKGMRRLGGAQVVDVQRCTSASTHIRLQLFEKQVELTRNVRGDANVRYGWFACTKEAIPKIALLGLGHPASIRNGPSFDFGIRLSSEHHSYSSANGSDIDENGVRYAVFCRVILGSMEVIHRGSKRCYPTCENYDSGVDNLHDPKFYVVWKANLNTHVFPEFVVSFKLSSYAEGFLAGFSRKKRQHNNVQNANSSPDLTEDHGEASSDSFVLSRKENEGAIEESKDSTNEEDAAAPANTRAPKSAYLPFPMLFDALSIRISVEDHNFITSSYDVFKVNGMSREEFVRRLRATVGDSVLKTAILSLPGRLPKFA